jgi:hypothetical protein
MSDELDDNFSVTDSIKIHVFCMQDGKSTKKQPTSQCREIQEGSVLSVQKKFEQLGHQLEAKI